jgi:hypothetical protein
MSLSPGKPGEPGPRGNHLQSDCRRDGHVSSIALLSTQTAPKARLQETWRSGIGSSAIAVRGSSGVSTLGAPRGRRRKVSSVGAFSSCVDAAPFSEPRAPLTRERAGRRRRRPRPSTYLLSGAIPSGHGTDGAARTKPFLVAAPSVIQGRSRIRRLVLSRARRRTFRRQKRPSVSLRLHAGLRTGGSSSRRHSQSDLRYHG